jgi:hypothetical protein
MNLIATKHAPRQGREINSVMGANEANPNNEGASDA